LVEPWASVVAQNVGDSVQVLAAFASQTGGLGYDLAQQLIRWLIQHARLAFSNRQTLLCGCYDDSMDMLTLQTLYASLESIVSWNWQQPLLQWEGRRENMLTLLSQVERFTFTPKFQVSSDAVLIAQSLSRPPDLKSIHGSIQNALSLVIDRIQPNAPVRPKQVRIVTASGPIMYGRHSVAT
jgi:hypothetical protein